MLRLRNVAQVTSLGVPMSEQYMAMKDAPEKLLVHVEAKKR
jgi:hypothetical protein